MYLKNMKIEFRVRKNLGKKHLISLNKSTNKMISILLKILIKKLSCWTINWTEAMERVIVAREFNVLPWTLPKHDWEGVTVLTHLYILSQMIGELGIISIVYSWNFPCSFALQANWITIGDINFSCHVENIWNSWFL